MQVKSAPPRIPESAPRGLMLCFPGRFPPLLRSRTPGRGIVWADQAHITASGLRSLGGLGWRIWFHLGATQQYYPVLHSAF